AERRLQPLLRLPRPRGFAGRLPLPGAERGPGDHRGSDRESRRAAHRRDRLPGPRPAQHPPSPLPRAKKWPGGGTGRRAASVKAGAGGPLGSTAEVVDVAGSTVIAPPGQVPTVGNGGLLAQPTNSGHFSRDQFAVVPEVGINVGYQVTEHLRAFVGYSFLYWSNVARPGD